MPSKTSTSKPRVPRTCEHCFASFFVWPNQVATGGGRFCGLSCRSQARRGDTAERLWSRVDRSGGTEACWLWTLGVNEHGYGRMGIGDDGVELTHRIAWKLTHGPIPPETPHVLHRCDNPPCCNPAHLFLGTYLDNEKDKQEKGRARRGEAHPMARLTENNVLAIRAALAAGNSIGDEAARYGVSWATVWHVAQGHTWKHVK